MNDPAWVTQYERWPHRSIPGMAVTAYRLYHVPEDVARLIAVIAREQNCLVEHAYSVYTETAAACPCIICRYEKAPERPR